MSRFKVVKNRAGQYSIWPADRENPVGWNDTGTIGSEDHCLKKIEEVWTDLRPLSVRERSQKLQEMKRKIGRG